MCLAFGFAVASGVPSVASVGPAPPAGTAIPIHTCPAFHMILVLSKFVAVPAIVLLLQRVKLSGARFGRREDFLNGLQGVALESRHIERRVAVLMRLSE